MPEESAVASQQGEPIVQATPEQIQNQIGMAMAFDDPSLMPALDNQPATTAAVGSVATADPNNPTPASTPDYTPFLKETFGIESVDEVKTQWQELQALKANPPKAEAIKYQNEESEKVAKLLSEGKIKEVMEVYSKQEKISNAIGLEVNKETAGDIIKLGISLKNPDLTPQEIEFQYKQEYVAPKEPVQRSSETDEEFTERQDEWKEKVAAIEMKTIIAAKMVKPDLEAAKVKIQLPNINPATVDADFEAYKASTAAADEVYNNVTVPGIKSLKETDVQLGFKVDDANNQMNFDVVLVPTKEDFEKARQDSLSVGEFLTKTCYDKDGKFLPQKLQRMILLEQQFDNYAQSIARQAVNEERKRVIAKEAPNGNGSRDYNVNGEMSELQKQMNFALS